ncbi:TPA: RES family NAD+ phosphorylase [Klebsiella oxytoca]|nr:RES family NAD+ phosphorylase [Klebsiella oxytoca]HBG9760945.1 RES family NAD+ phosphorylase [Klebsiella oxytoca]HBM2929088.1 RES family NAD+ phosphorylase [Klebsiella oxytoca]
MLSEEEKETLRNQDPYGFELIFYEELESWLSQDIACCDNCYDDLIKNWPYVYSSENCKFQKNSMPLDCFYSGTHLRELYSESDFFKYLQLIDCPRCGVPLTHNLWAYELPFDVVDGFESKVKELSKLITVTPFLVLSHPFAQEVYSAIRSLSNKLGKVKIGSNLFRARTNLKDNEVRDSSFDFAPKDVVKDGRYNHAGYPVLYCSFDAGTCIEEMRNESCHVATINCSKEMKIMDLTDPYEANHEFSDLLNSLVYSSLLSAKCEGQGYYKPEYLFSRFLSDCARQVGFDAIQFPSTRMQKDSWNLVILNREVSIGDGLDVIDIKFHPKK